MSTFPSVIGSFTNPNPTDRLNNPSHSGIEIAQNSNLTAVETFIGVEGSSSVVGTLVYDIRSPGSNGGGHVQTVNKGGTSQTLYNKGDLLVAQSSSVLAKLSVGGDGTILTADSNQATGIRWGSGKFGGTGVDGPLSFSANTNPISVGSVMTFVKNYSSISITGTAIVQFTSPNANGTVVILKSQGDVTLTSSSAPMLDTSGMGGAKGTGGISNGTQSGTTGGSGLVLYGPFQTGGGGAPVFGNASQGAAGVVSTIVNTYNSSILSKYGTYFAAGAGGGGGGSGNNTGGPTTGGDGGAGGGVLIIECGGAINFTTANGISVAGKDGSNGSNGGAQVGGRGGSGGGGGTAIILYNTLTAFSGTVNVAGGAAGQPGTGATGTTSAGAGSGAGALTTGTIGLSASSAPVAGVAGGTGFAVVMKNTDFS